VLIKSSQAAQLYIAKVFYKQFSCHDYIKHNFSTEVAYLLLKAGASHSVMDKEVIKPSVKLRKSNIEHFK
jgi:hypothetical protein